MDRGRDARPNRYIVCVEIERTLSAYLERLEADGDAEEPGADAVLLHEVQLVVVGLPDVQIATEEW